MIKFIRVLIIECTLIIRTLQKLFNGKVTSVYNLKTAEVSVATLYGKVASVYNLQTTEVTVAPYASHVNSIGIHLD